MKTPGPAGEFDVVMQHLGAALDELQIPGPEQDELVGLLRPMRRNIVEVESPQTGTPLPDSYQAAPPERDRPGLLTSSRRPCLESTPAQVLLMAGGRGSRADRAILGWTSLGVGKWSVDEETG